MAIEKAPADKMMKADEVEVKNEAPVSPAQETANEQDYFFPELGRTARAASQEEALAKIKANPDNSSI